MPDRGDAGAAQSASVPPAVDDGADLRASHAVSPFLGKARWLAVAAVALVAGIAAGLGVHQVVLSRELAALQNRGREAATLSALLLQGELEKQRAVPLVLAEDPDVRAALRAPIQARVEALDMRLEALAAETRASVIYLLDARGVAIAASNWRRPDSFVASDYSFRPYFQRAVADEATEYFALGNVSLRPGLYLGRRIESANRLLGVIVVKVEFDAIEQGWRELSAPVFVTDPRGIVLITSVPEWRFDTDRPLDDAVRAEIRASRQFGASPLEPLPLGPPRQSGGQALVALEGAKDRPRERFLEVAVPVATKDWMLHVLMPADGPGRRASAAGWASAAAVCAVLFGAAGIIVRRRDRARASREDEARMRAELEARVRERTAALSTANGLLLDEMEERRRAEASREVLRDELRQANRLATLGQIAAGVAHEISQPVAAIRTYADNADTYLARGDTSGARRSVGTIAGLTERIGAITAELRGFGRKAPTETQEVSIRQAIDGALLLVGHRLRAGGITLKGPVGDTDIVIIANRVRLEQVLVNLLQNAIDALADRIDGAIEIGLSIEEDAVLEQAAGPSRMAVITVADNGPGLAPEILGALFTPFSTTKPKGLGLGLVISHDIVSRAGGTLSAFNRPEGGAVFTVRLPLTPPLPAALVEAAS